MLIFANSERKLLNKIDICSKETEKHGLDINKGKTEIMQIAYETKNMQLVANLSPIKM